MGGGASEAGVCLKRAELPRLKRSPPQILTPLRPPEPVVPCPALAYCRHVRTRDNAKMCERDNPAPPPPTLSPKDKVVEGCGGVMVGVQGC